MKARFLIPVITALIPLLLSTSVLAQPPVIPSTSNPATGERTKSEGFASPDVLWNQPVASGTAMASQYFPDYSAGAGLYCADDFQITDNRVIESIYIPGTTASLFDAESLHWIIYSDTSGEPSSHPEASGYLWRYTCLPDDPEVTISGSTDVTLDLTKASAAPLNLSPGTYWLCFYPTLNLGSYGQWFWESSDTTNLESAQQIDPGNIIGTGYTTWTPIKDTASDPELYDLAFRLEGTLGLDYGDAPEDALAYPYSLVTGAFPTCKNVLTAGYIEHNNFGAWFGPAWDFEADGNSGCCPLFNPDSYDQDECFNDGDAGLVKPEPYTLVGSTVVAACPGCSGSALGTVCQQAQWGGDIDIDVHNTMPGHEEYMPAYVNVLVDWNQDGQWGGSSMCSGGNTTPEHVLVNYMVPPLYIGTLSALGPADFTIGPKQGYVWTRFSITETEVPEDWDGSGVFEDGETEDYLLRIDGELPVGGTALSVDRFGLLLPWLIITALVAATTVIVVKMRLA